MEVAEVYYPEAATTEMTTQQENVAMRKIPKNELIEAKTNTLAGCIRLHQPSFLPHPLGDKSPHITFLN